MNDRTATEIARVAAVLHLADLDAVETVDRWLDQRAKTGRPIGSAAAVLAGMSDADIRTDLSRYAPRAKPTAPRTCPRCADTNGFIEDPATRKPTGRCQHNEPPCPRCNNRRFVDDTLDGQRSPCPACAA